MAGNATTSPQTQTTWMDEMDEVSSGSSNFLKFAADEDEKVLRIVKDPVKGVSKFPYPDGSPKPEFKIEVMPGESNDIKVWAVTNRSIMQQLLGICRKEGMSCLAGSTLRVTATGNGKDRRWFIKLLQKPGQAAPQQPAPQQADPGQQWLQGQMQGAAQPGAR